jgi:hypothetical protein
MPSRIVARLVYNKFPEIIRKMPNAALDIIEETLGDIDNRVQSGMAASGSPSAPGAMPGIDTGNLAGSLQKELDRGNHKGTYYTNVEYALYLEVGTSRMLARPFLTPAAERNRKVFLQKMGNLESRLR